MNSGVFKHSHHFPIFNAAAHLPSKHLDVNEKAIVLSMAKAKASDGVCRNVLYARTGIYLHRHHIKYMHDMKDRIKEDMLKVDAPSAEQSLVDLFKKRNLNYVVLYHAGPGLTDMVSQFVSLSHCFCVLHLMLSFVRMSCVSSAGSS